MSENDLRLLVRLIAMLVRESDGPRRDQRAALMSAATTDYERDAIEEFASWYNTDADDNYVNP